MIDLGLLHRHQFCKLHYKDDLNELDKKKNAKNVLKKMMAKKLEKNFLQK